MANEFFNFYRSTFMGQRDRVNAEKKAAKAEEKAAKANAEAEEARTKVEVGSFLTNLRNAIESAVKETANKVESSKKTAEPVVEDTNIVEYTYKPGDTFGQVIKDLGLESGNGLWGENGDVAFYTKQLNDQGITGNIPIGTTIKLRHRNAPEQTTQPMGKVVEEAKYPALQKVVRSGSREV